MKSWLQTFSYGLRVLKLRLTRRPVLTQASLYLTHRCNLRCLYCSSPYMHTVELSTKQWQTVVAELAELGCRRILLLGGEPLLRKDIGDIISAVKAQKMSCVLTSNGVLVPRYLQQLKLLDTLVLSLDAVGLPNDKVRGTGVFAAVHKAIGLARQAGIPVKLNAVMTSDSAPCLDELIQFVAAEDVAVTLNVVRSGNVNLWHAAATVQQDEADIRSLLLKIAELARSNQSVLFSEHTYRFAAGWPDYDVDRLEAKDPGNQHLDGGPECHAGRAYFSIGPDGSAFPCALTADSILGNNAVTNGVQSAWKSLNDHPCRSCSSPCMIEQNYLYSLHPKVLKQFVCKHMTRYA